MMDGLTEGISVEMGNSTPKHGSELTPSRPLFNMTLTCLVDWTGPSPSIGSHRF